VLFHILMIVDLKADRTGDVANYRATVLGPWAAEAVIKENQGLKINQM
jgi:hypothetical protein